MQVSKVQTTTFTKSTNNLNSNTAAILGGAALGSVGAFVLPSKQELGNVFNKDRVDTFVSSVSQHAKDRSIIKYAGFGAIALFAINALVKAFSKKEPEKTNIEYSKWDALLDASDYACMATWYSDNLE